MAVGVGGQGGGWLCCQPDKGCQAGFRAAVSKVSDLSVPLNLEGGQIKPQSWGRAALPAATPRVCTSLGAASAWGTFQASVRDRSSRGQGEKRSLQHLFCALSRLQE